MATKIFYYGLLLLASSSAFLAISGHFFKPDDSVWTFALLMLSARVLGVGAFVLGAWLLFLQNFGRALLLIVGSIVLPCLSFYLFGTI